MPNYDYKCQKCEEVFEVFQSMNDPKLTECPQADCDGEVRRLLGTGAGLIFKGTGFYQTDYRSDSYKAGEKKASDAQSPKKEKKDSKKSPDNKPTKSSD